MNRLDATTQLAQTIKRLAELIVKKPEKDRVIRLRSKDIDALRNNKDHSHVVALRIFCQEHQIKIVTHQETR